MSNEDLVPKDNSEEEAPESYPCICGFNGPIANHLRVFFQCAQVLKEQAGIGAEMTDEEFCVRAALLVGQCPAFCCPGGNHSKIQDVCLNWWKSVGWEIMEWEGQPHDVTSALIKTRTSKFLKELERNEAHQQNRMNQSGRRGELDGDQQKGNPGGKLIDKPKEMVSPSVAPPEIPLQAANQNDQCRDVAEVEFNTLEKVKAISRSEMPGCLHVTKLIPLGIRFAASLGILCRWPSLPINGNSIVPMNGNCIWTCFIHANNPKLRGANLEQAVWELRIRAVGTFIDRMKLFNDDQWSLLQAIVTGNGEVTPLRDEIRQEMEKYMESGVYSGNLGDIILNIAASFSQQPVLVIEVKGCKVTNAHWVDPNEIFGGENKSLGFPVVILKQLNHCEVLPIAGEAKDTARMKYQQWKASERVGVSPVKENVNPGVVYDAVGSHMGNLAERTMLEPDQDPDDIFEPPITSTPVQRRNEGQEGRSRTARNVCLY